MIVDMRSWAADAETLSVARMADLFIVVTGASRAELDPTARLMLEFRQAGIGRRKIVVALSKVLDDSDDVDACAYLATKGIAGVALAMSFHPSQ
ncbi:MAG: hypothetical protein WBX25_13150 [Rhodomicrobium sp.]